MANDDECVWAAQYLSIRAFSAKQVEEIVAEISTRISSGRAMGLNAMVSIDPETGISQVRVWNDIDLKSWTGAWLPKEWS